VSGRRSPQAIGTVAGGAFALAKAHQQRPEHLFLQLLGGLIAGGLGDRRLGGYGSHVALDALNPADLALLA
jgi:hypothetical protein